jgi:hypothetical protein
VQELLRDRFAGGETGTARSCTPSRTIIFLVALGIDSGGFAPYTRGFAVRVTPGLR